MVVLRGGGSLISEVPLYMHDDISASNLATVHVPRHSGPACSACLSVRELGMVYSGCNEGFTFHYFGSLIALHLQVSLQPRNPQSGYLAHQEAHPPRTLHCTAGLPTCGGARRVHSFL